MLYYFVFMQFLKVHFLIDTNVSPGKQVKTLCLETINCFELYFLVAPNNGEPIKQLQVHFDRPLAPEQGSSGFLDTVC